MFLSTSYPKKICPLRRANSLRYFKYFHSQLFDVFQEEQIFSFTKNLRIILKSGKVDKGTNLNFHCMIFSCPEQPNRWPCHSLTHWVTDGTFTFDIPNPLPVSTGNDLTYQSAHGAWYTWGLNEVFLTFGGCYTEVLLFYGCNTVFTEIGQVRSTHQLTNVTQRFAQF